jgi:hypothetical protein
MGLAAALIFNPGWLQSLWVWVSGLPPLPRILAWIFLTPLLAALWIWNAPWSLALRLLGFAGLLGWTGLAVSSFIREWL